MAELTADAFTTLCTHGPVREQIATIETTRRRAVRRFWLVLLAGSGAAIVTGLLAGDALGGTVGSILFMVVLIGAFILAWSPLAAASEGIKHPALAALAAQGGMTYMPSGFDPPVLAEARAPLFGSWLSSAVFTDLFYGEDGDARRFAFYEATLSRGSGKHRTQVFSGQVYAFQRRRTQSGAVVAVPDRGLFNFFKPSGGFVRVTIENAPDFEKKFELYATQPHEATMLFGSLTLRALLLRLRESGRIFAYIGPEDVLVAITGKNRFEPGSMFRSRAGEERVRLMFDDVCASLRILDELKASLS
ncbi:MAG TPA: DUF3137 domain-containing protein [Allosphingosinicella sp.]|nr:DUF3137 domain-containing protein [Allosphingosinicella sp.]